MYGHPADPRLVSLAAARAGVALAVCALHVRPGEKLVRLFPAGRFDAPRGSLAGQGPWFIDAALAAQVIARVAARTTDIPIDYEHQILLAEKNGQPAPAAGWVDRTSLVWISDGGEPGLYGAVRWTARAAQWIDDESYRYLSPVFPYAREGGAVLDLYHVALTNTPAIDTDHVVAAATARFAPPDVTPAGGRTPENTTTEVPEMELLNKLLAALGLPETTSEADALAGVAALKAKADAGETELAALKASTEAGPDLSKYVPIETAEALKGEVAALRAQIGGGEVDQLVETAMADGRLLESQRAWAEELGRSNIAALRKYVDSSQPIAALRGPQSRTMRIDPTQPQTTDADLAVCKALGLTPEEFAKGKLEGR